MKFVETWVISVETDGAAWADAYVSERELLESLWERYGDSDEAESDGLVMSDGKPADLAAWARGELGSGCFHNDRTAQWGQVMLPVDALKVHEADDVASAYVLAHQAMAARDRLEYLRSQIRAEQISYGEIAELQGLVEYIDKGDVELLEWAGVPG